MRDSFDEFNKDPFLAVIVEGIQAVESETGCGIGFIIIRRKCHVLSGTNNSSGRLEGTRLHFCSGSIALRLTDLLRVEPRLIPNADGASAAATVCCVGAALGSFHILAADTVRIHQFDRQGVQTAAYNLQHKRHLKNKFFY